MKKLHVIIIMLVSAVFIIGCYDDNKNAKVRINLGNIPIAKQIDKRSFLDRIFSVFVKDSYAQTVGDFSIQVVHFGIYAEGELIARESINGNDIAIEGGTSYVELSVPAGNSRTILVLGEFDSDGTLFAGYFGSNTLDLPAGSTKTVSIIMRTEVGYYYNSKSGNLTWDYLGGNVRYAVQLDGEESIYNGYKNYIPIDYSECHGYTINIVFEDFGLDAENSTYIWGPGSDCAK
jgi:hypothetical protein